MELQAETAKIWSAFQGRLLSFIRGRVGNPQDADDILQEVFARIHGNAAGLDDLQSISGWVFSITRNAITDHYRERARASGMLAQLADEQEAGGGAVVSDAIEADDPLAAELGSCMRPLVRQLPTHYADAVEMTELDGMTQQQAAEQAGITLSGMKARVQRGRGKLKDALLQCCDVELDRRHRVTNIEPRPGADCCGGRGCDGCE